MLQKIKNLIKLHYQSILIFIGILLIISPVILSRELNDLDEIWNYNFARNISNGLIPYKDFNMLQTPLLPFINGLILKLFGNELIIMRFLAILLITSIFFMIYKIFKKLNVNIFYNLICVFSIFLILKDYICIDYNFAILFLTLILIYLELDILKKYKNNYLCNFFIGLICGCCILFKQSTGIIISLISIIYPILTLLINNEKNNIKDNIKLYFKITLVKIIAILIPIIILIIYLLINNAFYDFINYTILGIKTFSNSISYMHLLNSKNLVIKLLSIFMPIFILITGIYLLIKKKNNLYGFYSYSIASLIVIYPIADNIHFLIGITPFLIFLFYLIFNLFKLIRNKLNIKIDNLFKNNKAKINNKNIINKFKIYLYEFIKFFIILYLIIYLITSFILLKNYLNDENKNHNINHYKNIIISDSLINKINIIDNYILSQINSVYILDAEAAIYMIPIDKYNKDFDMFLKGNLGSDGELGQINKIKNSKPGTKILIKNNKYNLNWQTPLEVIYFIRNNLNKIGEISIFDIYEIN